MIVGYAEISVLRVPSCRRPPRGWECRFAAGHPGPCQTFTAGVLRQLELWWLRRREASVQRRVDAARARSRLRTGPPRPLP